MNEQDLPPQQEIRPPRWLTSSVSSPTPTRILDAAVIAYGLRGYDGTSLDDLAGDIGVRKQTILYWFPSKEVLLAATIDHAAGQVVDAVLRALGGNVDRADPWGTIEGVVRTMFRLASRRPALLGLVREVSRLGATPATQLATTFQPLIDDAASYLQERMDGGSLRAHDPRLLLLSAYSMVVGVATEVEVLRAFGEEPTLSSLVRRRDEMLRLLHTALVIDN